MARKALALYAVIALCFGIWLSVDASADVVENMELTNVTCSGVGSRRACLRLSRFCEWRPQGLVPGLHRCEQKRIARDLFVKPYVRVGNPPSNRSIPPLYERSLASPKCAKKAIFDLGEDECYANSWRNLNECGCNTEFEKTYMIPLPRDPVELDRTLLANRTMFVFIHANKAAGETIKTIGYSALAHHEWDGAGYATKSGWQFLEQTFWPKTRRWLSGTHHLVRPLAPRSLVPMKWSPLTDTNRGRIMYSSCGSKFSTFTDVSDYMVEEGFSLSQARECPLRFVWGNSGMGLCDHFPGMPCVYFIALRDPLARALSDYSYFCLDGAEGKKKWTPEMIKAGACNMSPLEWFESMRTSPYFFVERLTRGCNKDCGPQVALANLFHPCVRYVLVEKFADGLRKLKQTFYPAFSTAIDAYLQNPKRVNRRGHGTSRASLKMPELSNSTLDALRSFLREDYIIYNEAVRRYEEQWTRPLISCNAIPI